MAKDVRYLTENYNTRLKELIAAMGQGAVPQPQTPTPQRLIAVVKCGDYQGTLPEGGPAYYACSDIQAVNSDGVFENLTSDVGWLVSAGKATLAPGKTCLAVAGPLWSPDPATVEARTMFIAAFDEGAKIARIPDPATLDGDGFADGYIQEWNGPANSDHQDGRAIKVQFL
ncbi:hypothetical protein [Zavarzinella formosa]|uniref:hypothetical protein n=1 Tax=Zavarzinella formosa TaxID=360055 RepID=UPI0002F48B5F|nr:hypothetical protein [Zavarzinella formosa]